MSEPKDLELELTKFVHDLFLEKGYLEWRKNLKQYKAGVWHSLIVKIDEHNAPLDRLKEIGVTIYSKLVFSYIKAPDYKDSRMLMERWPRIFEQVDK